MPQGQGQGAARGGYRLPCLKGKGPVISTEGGGEERNAEERSPRMVGAPRKSSMSPRRMPWTAAGPPSRLPETSPRVVSPKGGSPTGMFRFPSTGSAFADRSPNDTPRETGIPELPPASPPLSPIGIAGSGSRRGSLSPVSGIRRRASVVAAVEEKEAQKKRESVASRLGGVDSGAEGVAFVGLERLPRNESKPVGMMRSESIGLPGPRRTASVSFTSDGADTSMNSRRGSASGSQRRASLVETQQARGEEARQRREELEAQKMRQVEEDAARAEEKRAHALDAGMRAARQLGVQRCSIWLHVLLSAAMPRTLHRLSAEERALNRLKKTMLPCLMLYRFRKVVKARRAQRETEMLQRITESQIAPPSVPKLRASIGLFEEWGDYSLEKIREAMMPMYFKHDEFVVMEGDWGQEMYVIQNGDVEISARDPKKKSKSHIDGKMVLATVSHHSAAPFFGEFAVLSDEPRQASVRVTSEGCDLWCIRKGIVLQQLRTLPPRVQRNMRTLADQRRTDILAKIHPLTPEALRQVPCFRQWTIPALQRLAALFTARVVRPHTLLVTEGEKGDSLFFVASGKVGIYRQKEQPPQKPQEVPLVTPASSEPGNSGGRQPAAWKKKGRRSSLSSSTTKAESLNSSMRQRPSSGSPVPRTRQMSNERTETDERTLTEPLSGESLICPEDYGERITTIGTGSVFGEIAVLFLEPRCASVVSLSACDLWVLSKPNLMSILSERPDWFVAAKTQVNQERARRLPQCTAGMLTKDSLLSQSIPLRALREIAGQMTPRIVERGDLIFQDGGPPSLWYLQGGIAINEKSHETICEGSVIGAAEVLTFQPRRVGIRADSKCELHEISAIQLWATLRGDFQDTASKLEGEKWQGDTTRRTGLPLQKTEEPEQTSPGLHKSRSFHRRQSMRRGSASPESPGHRGSFVSQ
eukprot:Hpha_TRINITY_DN11502_c0_g1::TRINITY_DN11502_c0_g1_i2::g.32123::m.32123